MTIERTRQILGQKVAHLTDEQVLMLIQKTDKAAEALFKLAVKKAYTQNKKNSLL